MSHLVLDRVSFAHAGFAPVLDAVDLALASGEIHCLVGRSGCGKTTLLKLAAGLIAPTGGRVLVQGREHVDMRAIGFVFQAPTLLEWLTVRDNVLLPVTLHRSATDTDAREAERLLAQLGLGDHASRFPRQLSGGQQSRVALARALLLQPPLLLLDEPFAALDAITRDELQQDLARVCRARKTTVLFVTHDVGEAVFLADRVSVMAKGRLAATVEVPLARPREAHTRYTPAFAHACERVHAALMGEEIPA